MILQSTLSPSSPHPISSPLYYPHGSSSSSFVSFPIIRTHQLYNNISIKCSISQSETMDYEKKNILKWNNIFKRISTMENPQMDVASVLNQCQIEGKKISKWEICRIVKELRKFRRFKLALEVYEWMNNRIEKYMLSSSDTAIQLDLIAKVRGVKSAEDYYTRVPDTLKDKRIYGALLNAYVGAKLRDKAENLMEQMRNRGHAVLPLPYNVMMTLYMKLNEFDKVDGLISEMKLKSIPLDLYSYNIWLSARGSQGSAEAMEQVFEEMSLDPNIIPSWTTFSTMAAMYVKMGELEKAEQCLRDLETRITGRDKMPYHYLISLYGSLGNREEVYRVWNLYRSVIPNIHNWGYHSVISSLIRSGDIEGAEKLYEEWLPVKTSYEPKVGNLLMAWYVKKEPFEKVKGFFDHMIEAGGKPNATSWEILGEAHLKERRISEALACFKEAISEEGGKNWKLKPSNVNIFLELCDEEDNQAAKEDLIALLTLTGVLQDEGYRSFLTGFGDKEVKITDEQVMFNDPEMLYSVTE
ncbi:hypothetical protein KSS87_016122 [Heliosperma pusillum]|nr:hypothetical protein KSS87_016122 [Heliosperma pusillum]